MIAAGHFPAKRQSSSQEEGRSPARGCEQRTSHPMSCERKLHSVSTDKEVDDASRPQPETSKLRKDVGVFSGKKLTLRQPRIETLSRTYHLNAHRTHSLRANTFAASSPEPYWHPSIRRCTGMTSASRAGCRKRTCCFLARTRTNIVPYLIYLYLPFMIEYRNVPTTAIADPVAPRGVSLLPKTSTVARMMQTRLIVLAMEWVTGDTWLRVMKATSLYA